MGREMSSRPHHAERSTDPLKSVAQNQGPQASDWPLHRSAHNTFTSE